MHPLDELEVEHIGAELGRSFAIALEGWFRAEVVPATMRAMLLGFDKLALLDELVPHLRQAVDDFEHTARAALR